MAVVLPTGVQAKFWAVQEATYNTHVAYTAATDAVPLISFEITPSYEFHPSKERTGTASLQREIAGLKGGTWSASMYAKPEGTTVNAIPDISPFLLAAFGDQNTSGDVTYRMHDGTNEVFTPTSLQISRQVGSSLLETVNGAWIEQVDIEIVGNAETIINVSGGFASYGWCYGAQTNGAISSTSAVDVTVDSATAERIGVVGATVADDSTIEPFAQAGVLTANNPLGGVGCGLSIGGTVLGLISFKVSYKTGIHGLATEASATGPNRLAKGAREVTGEISSYFLTSTTATEDISRIVGGAWNGATLALIARAGADTTKERMKIQVPSARISVSPVSLPETEEATVSLSFVARQSSTGGDELSIDFD